jgi:hypothetical protein
MADRPFDSSSQTKILRLVAVPGDRSVRYRDVLTDG